MPVSALHCSSISLATWKSDRICRKKIGYRKERERKQKEGRRELAEAEEGAEGDSQNFTVSQSGRSSRLAGSTNKQLAQKTTNTKNQRRIFPPSLLLFHKHSSVSPCKKLYQNLRYKLHLEITHLQFTYSCQWNFPVVKSCSSRELTKAQPQILQIMFWSRKRIKTFYRPCRKENFYAKFCL